MGTDRIEPHVLALDGLRGVAITCVILLHAYSAHFAGGAVGVDVFFALSAYLITSLILHETAQRSGSFSYRAFYAKRVLRLAPALGLWLATVAPITALLIHEQGSIASSTLVSLVYIGDFVTAGQIHISLGTAYTQIWSLAVEEQFYAVWPLLLALLLRLSRRHLPVWLGALFVGAVIYQNFRGSYFLPSGHIAPIAAGAFAAATSMTVSRTGRAIRSIITIMSVGTLLLILIMATQSGWHPVESLILSAGLILVLRDVCNAQPSVAARALSVRPLRWLGRRSYGLYLYHRTLAIGFPAFASHFVTVRLLWAGPVVILLSCLLAELSFDWLERPVAVRGRRRIAKKEALDPAL